MIRAYRFQCRPTYAQIKWCNHALRLTRELWNILLADREAYRKEVVGIEPWQPKCEKQRKKLAESKEKREKFLAENPEYAERQEKMVNIFRAGWKDAKPGQKGITKREQDKCLKVLRAEFPEYSAIPQGVLRSVVVDLDEAFRAFFRRVREKEYPPGYPRYKSKRNPRQSLKFREKGVLEFDGGGSEFGYYRAAAKKGGGLPGRLRFRITNSEFLREGVAVKTTTVTHYHKGFLISFVCGVPDTIPVKSEDFIGVDLGIEKLMTTDDGTVFENPRVFKKNIEERRRKQRACSRKVKGSGNHKRANEEVTRIYAKEGNQRDWYRHQAVNQLVAKAVLENKSIAFENLDIKSLIESKGMPATSAKESRGNFKLSRSLSDASFGKLGKSIENAAERAGVLVVKVDPSFTSQDCSGCGARVPKPLSQRRHECPHCGLDIDRDVNAAINIKNRAVASPIGVNSVAIPEPFCQQNPPKSSGCVASVAPTPALVG